MKIALVILVTAVLSGCAGMSFEKQMAMVQERKQVAVAEIQSQNKIQQNVAANSFTRWWNGLTPSQQNEYQIAINKKKTADMKQNSKILEGIGNVIKRMFED